MARQGHNQKVFVSYSRSDAEWTRSFADNLSKRGFDVWSEDSTSISLGTNWNIAVASALRESDVVILVLSERSLDSADIWFELGAAMAGSKAVVPVVSSDLDVSKLPLPLQRVVFVTKDSPASTAARVASGLLKAS